MTQSKAQNNAVYSASLVSCISNKESSQILYCQKTTGERLRVYTIRNKQIATATDYSLQSTSKELQLISEPLQAGQLTSDTLHITFDDNVHTIIINQKDRYRLFPEYYARIKADLQHQHQLIPILQLLSDAIGDYPLEEVTPLLVFKSSANENVQSAQIVTQRSQADMTDSWEVKYRYNNHRLIAVNASNKEETRFTKKITYSAKGKTVNTYRNIESRQTVNQTIVFNSKRTNRISLKENVYETGKDRESNSEITLIKREIGQIPYAGMTPAEVLRITTMNSKN